jgi:hypothetical protein
VRLLKWLSVGLSGLHGKQLIHPEIRSRNRSHFLFGERVRNRALKALKTIGNGSTGFCLFLESRRFGERPSSEKSLEVIGMLEECYPADKN